MLSFRDIAPSITAALALIAGGLTLVYFTAPWREFVSVLIGVGGVTFVLVVWFVVSEAIDNWRFRREGRELGDAFYAYATAPSETTAVLLEIARKKANHER